MVILVSLLGACSHHSPQPPGVRVKLSSVQAGTIEESSEFIASLQSRCSETLQPPIDGQVGKIFVKLGERVAAGTAIIQGGESCVFVAQSPGKAQLVARKKTVKLGQIQGDNYQVIQGLQPGEKILVSGLLRLSDGAAIMPEER